MKTLLLLAMSIIIGFLVMASVTAATNNGVLGFLAGGVAAFSLGIAAAKDGL